VASVLLVQSLRSMDGTRDFHVPAIPSQVLTASIVGVQPGITLTQRLRRASASAWVCFPRSNSSACAASIRYLLPYRVLFGSAPEDATKVANELISVQIAVELAELLDGPQDGVSHFGEVVQDESLVKYEVGRGCLTGGAFPDVSKIRELALS
jgi:hypothetical protein